MKAFVCHYTKLTERKQYLENELPELGFNDIEWVTENDIQHYNVEKVYDPSPEAFEKRNQTAFSKFGVKPGRSLKPAEIELTLQHFECYRRIAEQHPTVSVIFEDDVIFNSNFSTQFPRYLDELPEDWDVFYFGRGCGGHYAPMSLKERVAYLFGKKHIFRNKKHQSRFTDSYMVSPKAARKIYDQCFPFHMGIDWELNYLQSSMNLSIYWAEPTLTRQGSKYGKYQSSLKQAE